MQEWLRLAGEYRAKSDEELREIFRDFADLTERLPSLGFISRIPQPWPRPRKSLNKMKRARQKTAPGQKAISRLSESALQCLRRGVSPGALSEAAQRSRFPMKSKVIPNQTSPSNSAGKLCCANVRSKIRFTKSGRCSGELALRAGCSLAGTDSPTPAFWSPPTNSTGPAPSSPTPFHRTSSMSRTRPYPNTSLPVALGAAQKTPYSSLPSR